MGSRESRRAKTRWFKWIAHDKVVFQPRAYLHRFGNEMANMLANGATRYMPDGMRRESEPLSPRKELG